jgi:hypothetical protein
MEIPFDALLTLLIFLVGIPALILQLISTPERRVVVRRKRIDVNSFLRRASVIFAFGFGLQIIRIWYGKSYTNFNFDSLIEQGIWLATFIGLFSLVFIVSKQIPEQYGQREKIIESLANDVLKDAKKNGRIGGETFSDLASLGSQCEAGQEREMVISQFKDFVLTVLKDDNYTGESFEALIEELIYILTSKPEQQDLECYDLSIKMLAAILSKNTKNASDNDKRRSLNAISLLGRTLLEHFESVEADNLILDFVDTAEFAVLNGGNLLTDVSQTIFEIGECASAMRQDFIAVASLDKLSTLAISSTPMPDEFSVDLLGLISHLWVEGGSRKKYADQKLEAIQPYLTKDLVLAIRDAATHCYITLHFDTADKLGKMQEELAKQLA